MGIECKYVKVRVQRSLVSAPVLTVMGHEVPILKARHGEGKISLAEYQTEATRFVEDVREEFSRLQRHYGSAKDADRTYVEEIYGNPQLDTTYEVLGKQMEKDFMSYFKDASGQQVERKKKNAPKTNHEGSAKVTKANLNKGSLIAWLADQGFTEDEEGEPLKAMKASDLTVWAKLKMHEMIEDMEMPVPSDDYGTKSLSRMVISYQEEG